MRSFVVLSQQCRRSLPGRHKIPGMLAQITRHLLGKGPLTQSNRLNLHNSPLPDFLLKGRQS